MATQPLLGEVRPFGFNFNPRGWAFCQGQILPIASNTALFSLLGTTYGGNGTTTFALPDFRGTTLIGMGQGPGLPLYVQGETGGAASVALLPANLPPHTHGIAATAALPARGPKGSVDSPINNVMSGSTTAENYSDPSTADGSLGGGTANLTAQAVGGSQPFGKMPPYLTINLCIATQGIYPQRS